MKKYIKFFINIIINYRFYSITIIIYELYFIFKFGSLTNKLKYLNDNYLSDSIPANFYVIKKISKFTDKNNINYICDLGSGYGKILNYFGNHKKINIDGIEYEKKIYLESKKLENNKIKFFNNNFFEFDFAEKNYSLLILNDPLKKTTDLEKITKKLISLNKNFFYVFINLSKDKINIIKKYFIILEFDIYSNSRNYFICKKK